MQMRIQLVDGSAFFVVCKEASSDTQTESFCDIFLGINNHTALNWSFFFSMLHYFLHDFVYKQHDIVVCVF